MSENWTIEERADVVVARNPVPATLWSAVDDVGRPRFVVTTDKKGPTSPNANPNGAALAKREAWSIWREKQRLAKGR